MASSKVTTLPAFRWEGWFLEGDATQFPQGDTERTLPNEDRMGQPPATRTHQWGQRLLRHNQ
jgi:hypothetical protein